MGLGHVIRSLALADMLKDVFDCHFIIRDPLPKLKEQILDVCSSIKVLNHTNDDIEESKSICNTYLDGNEIVVLDGYHFRTQYQQNIKDKGCKVVCIDDIHDYHFVADVVINHAPGINRNLYSREYYTKLCFGLDYTLIRRSFLEPSLEIKKNSLKKTAFICFGGSDFNNCTMNFLQSVKNQKPPIDTLNLVLGTANTHIEQIETFKEDNIDLEINIFFNLSADDMANLIQRSDIAIVPSSSILYEVLSFGIPTISGYYVDNQIGVHKGFKDLGVIYSVGDMNRFSDYGRVMTQLLLNENKHLKDQINGLSIKRSKSNHLLMFHDLKSTDLKIRKANENDLITYFNWVNEKEVRENSFTTEKVSLDNHKKWFLSKIIKENSALYIFEKNANPIGQVRFDIENNVALIDYSIDKNYRGKGYGKKILIKAIDYLFRDYEKVKSIQGKVKLSNFASARVFQNLNFQISDELEEQQSNYKTFLLEKKRK